MVPRLSNAKVVSILLWKSSSRSRRSCAAPVAGSAAPRSNGAESKRKRFMYAFTSGAGRQQRRGPHELHLGLERLVQGLDQEPTRRVAENRLLALRDRAVDHLQVLLDDCDSHRVHLV